MKRKILTIFLLTTAILSACNLETPIDTSTTTIIETPMFDACYNRSEHKVDFSDIAENREIEFEFDLSRIETDAAKQLIVDLYTIYDYSEYSLVDFCYDNMEEVDVTKYVVGLDDDYWLIVSDDFRAYADKDNIGIFSGAFDYLIDETEAPYR